MEIHHLISQQIQIAVSLFASLLPIQLVNGAKMLSHEREDQVYVSIVIISIVTQSHALQRKLFK
jgi:hypothetical protein